jgi:hypothetical protein
VIGGQRCNRGRLFLQEKPGDGNVGLLKYKSAERELVRRCTTVRTLTDRLHGVGKKLGFFLPSQGGGDINVSDGPWLKMDTRIV